MPMVVVPLKSAGIGNCMFQYAAAKSCALNMHGDLKIGLTDIQEHQMPFKDHYTHSERLRFLEDTLGVFGIKVPIADEREVRILRGWGPPTVFNKCLRELKRVCHTFPSTYYAESDPYSFDSAILSMTQNIYLDGYFINPRYFKKNESAIRKDFQFSVKASDQNMHMAEEIHSSNAVSIHVRVGDYVHDVNARTEYPVYGVEYYKLATEIIESKVSNPTFYVFSDNPEWAASNLHFLGNVRIITHNPIEKGYEDLRLMSQCKHHIITNSTFSWWGAWLNPEPDKLVVSPKKWINGHDASDLLLAGWHVIDAGT